MAIQPASSTLLSDQETCLNLDFSGTAGTRGQDGQNGAIGNGYGNPGEPGGPGAHGTAGTHARGLYLTLVADASSVTALWDDNSHRFAIGTAGNRILLRAAGGDGGSGGHGGQGGRGATGRRGESTAGYVGTRTGGPGGDGGAGGPGGDGADGGDGAKVVVFVSKAHTEALMLLPAVVDVAGGRAGNAGDAGAGGHGGDGGAGGRSRNFDTPHGGRGPRGRQGVAGTAGHAGQAGRNGSYTIRVQDEEGYKDYPGRYHLQTTRLDDGIAQPGQEFTARIGVRNTGPMPTPAHCVTELFVQGGDIAQYLGDTQIEIPRPLEAGQQAELDLRFRIKALPDMDENGTSVKVLLRAKMERVQQWFEPYTLQLQIMQPMTFSRLSLPQQIKTYDWYPLSLRIHNNSGAPGTATLHIKVAQESQLPQEHFVFAEGNPSRTGEESAELNIPLAFDRGESRDVEAVVRLLPCMDDLHGTLTLTTALTWNRPGTGAAELTQRSHRTVQVDNPFAIPEDSSHVLIANARTTDSEIEQWQTLLRGYGFGRLALWKLSERGDFHPARYYRHLEGKTLILLNQSIGGQPASHFMACDELGNAIRRYGCKLYVVGGSINKMDSYLRPTIPATTTEIRGKGIKALVKEISGGKKGPLMLWLNPYHFNLPFGHGKSDSAILEEEAQSLARQLGEKFPNRRFIVAWQREPRLLKGIGHITVWEPEPNHQASVVLSSFPDNEVGRVADFSHAHMFYLYKLIPLEQRLQQIPLSDTQKQFHGPLADAILSDLVEEQYTAKHGARDFPLLQQVCQFQAESRGQAKIVWEILESLKYFMDKWQSFTPKRKAKGIISDFKSNCRWLDAEHRRAIRAYVEQQLGAKAQNKEALLQVLRAPVFHGLEGIHFVQDYDQAAENLVLNLAAIHQRHVDQLPSPASAGASSSYASSSTSS